MKRILTAEGYYDLKAGIYAASTGFLVLPQLLLGLAFMAFALLLVVLVAFAYVAWAYQE